MRRRRQRSAAALACLALFVGGCSSSTPEAPPREPTPEASPGERATAELAEPWPDRPVVQLRFDVSPDLRSVSGSERVEFTPDLDTCELVFRAWPNKPATARAGNSLTVSEVRVDGQATDFRDIAAGAPERAPAGTLLEVPLTDCLRAGETRVVDLDFDVELGEDVDERVGTSATEEVAWFATAFPLLAWERERGWERAPAVSVTGEMAVSESFVLDSLEVVAPSDYEVLGTGRAVGTEEAADGTTTHRFTAPAVRDVAVSVGDLDVATRTIDGVRVHVGLDRSVDRSEPTEWLEQIAQSQRDLVDLLGPFPYDDLWVTVLSSQTSGIEFPGALQFGDVRPAERRGLVTHELAHMWFYGLVGNDQGEDPWLDESFATFAQSVADRDENVFAELAEADWPRVGEPMTYWAEVERPSRTYFDTVYTLGGAALVEARDRAGHGAFDAALDEYLRTHAYAIATPEDVREAFTELPEVLAVLREVGALH